ncbi:MAG: hypothetical protein JSU70_13200 [Phycisphaerales bacterium]|nr:MAG: hypothetical protein JSU70_13200 [Phycisphaerales bacterium]
MGRARRNRKGFNLVETVVASVILSGAVVTVAAISTRSLSNTRLNRQYETAASIVERQLRLIDVAGIDTFIETDQTEGEYLEFEPGYHWQVETQYEELDSLYLVTVTVTWVEGKRAHSISVDTRLDGVSLYAEVEGGQ